MVKHFRKNRYFSAYYGFTLIELLVVVSIIGMLSSIVLVSLTSARDKGRVGAAVMFDSGNYQAWGVDAYFYLDFESVDTNYSFPVVPNFTLAVPKCNNAFSGPGCKVGYLNSDTPNTSKYSLNFFPALNITSPLIFVPNQPITLSSYTISLWVKPQNTSGNISLASAVSRSGTGANIFNITLTDTGAGTYTVSVGDANNGMSSLTPTIPKNKWSNLTLSYLGNPAAGPGSYTAYIDGRKVLTRAANSAFADSGITDTIIVGDAYNATYTGYPPANPALISYPASITYLVGQIDNLALYNKALTDAQIEHIYADGLKTHILAEI